ncbi:MAG: LysR substrate-binding domain-containing protein [Vitreoscilla sp.]
MKLPILLSVRTLGKRIFCVTMTAEKLVHESATPPLRNLSGLIDFDCAARLASFKMAAAALHKTPAAVSQQVRNLEESLGFELFERHTRRIVLTERGRAFAATVERALAELRTHAQSLRDSDEAALLRISTTHSFALKWLALRIGRFTARHPGLDVRLAATDIAVDLAAGGWEVALRYGPATADDPTVLWHEHLVAVVSPALAPSGPPQPPALARLPLLYEGSPTAWRRFLADARVDVNESAFVRGFSHSGLLAQAAVAGQGAALVPYAIVYDDLAARRLVRVHAPALPNGFGYRFMTAAISRETTKVRLLREWLVQEMNEMRAALTSV